MNAIFQKVQYALHVKCVFYVKSFEMLSLHMPMITQNIVKTEQN